MELPDHIIAFAGPVETVLVAELEPSASAEALVAFRRAVCEYDSQTLTTYPVRCEAGRITMSITYDQGCPAAERERLERWLRAHPLVQRVVGDRGAAPAT